MSKRFWIFGGLILLAVIGMAALYAWIDSESTLPVFSKKEMDDQEVKMSAQTGQTNLLMPSAVAPLDMSQTVRLAIGSLGLTDNDQNQRLGDLVTVELTGAPGFNLVERQSLDAVLRELNLSLFGFVRAKDAVRAGKLLKADWFLLGTEAKINGTNAIIARVVDARTGILHDAGVFPCDKPPVQLAADLSMFMRESRQNAISAKTREYLAIGAFEDLSVNNRQADFPVQIRGYLIAAYQGGKVTLLEREYVDVLLREVRLDLAGLTEEGSANPPPMQSAFWLVSGQYQSYETTNFQVEVNLKVQRAFGRPRNVTIHGLPGEALDRQIKTAIDDILSQDAGGIVLSRMSEVHGQMSLGKDLIRPYLSQFSGLELVYIQNNWDLDSLETARQKRNLEEAMRAFQTVLLLEPTNRLAKMYMAACLRKAPIGRPDEARNYYREIIEEPIQDQWSGPAQKALLLTFERGWWGGPTPDEEARWFNSACQHTTNSVAREFYRRQVDRAMEDVTIQNGDSQLAQDLAEKHLFAAIQSYKNAKQGKPGTDESTMGIFDFVKTLNLNPSAAAQKLTDLLPELERQAPEMKPYLRSVVLRYQLETNAPMVAEFQKTLHDCIEHPERVFEVAQFWQLVGWSVYDWCYEKTNYALAVNLMEGKRRAAAGGNASFGDQDKIRLAYAYCAVQRWQDALDLFEGFTNKPVQVDGNGPWGKAFRPIYPDDMVSYCRKELGLPEVRNPRKFDMGNCLLCLCTPSTFVADKDGLWIGIAGQLLHLDFDLKTNLAINLPIDASVPVTALCLTSSNIWIATSGAGLVEFDKTSQQCRQFHEADGLMMDYVSSLHLAADSLWIGYGSSSGGGLGRLDLRSQKFDSFMPGLNASAGSSLGAGETPPRQAVGNIVTGIAGELWMLVGSGIRTFQEAQNSWGAFAKTIGEWVTCFSADPERLVESVSIQQIEIEIETKPGLHNGTNQIIITRRTVSPAELAELEENFQTNGNHQRICGQSIGGVGPKAGLKILSLRDKRWQFLEDADGMPNPPTTMTLEGNDLWVGGEGFIALVDLKQAKVRKYCHIHAVGVDRIQIGGGYVWAQFDWHLYRAPLSDLN